MGVAVQCVQSPVGCRVQRCPWRSPWERWVYSFLVATTRGRPRTPGTKCSIFLAKHVVWASDSGRHSER